LKQLRVQEPQPFSNDLPIPDVGVGDQVDLKQVEWDQVENLRLLGHANLPLKLMMVLTKGRRQDTRDEVQGVLQAIKEINQDTGMSDPRDRLKLHLILGDKTSLHDLNLSEEDRRDHVEVNRYFGSTDVWLQDWGEIGAVMVKGAEKERTVIVDTNRGRGLAALPGSVARNWNSHYLKGPPGQGAGNYGGNIEVTPDDILVIGDSSSPKIQSMFRSMGYQDRSVVLETKWLLVGHVDEYISFLPTPDTPLGYAIVKADPKLAMELLRKTSPSHFETSLSDMIFSAFRYATHFPEMLSTDGRDFGLGYMQVSAIHSGLHGVSMNLGRIASKDLLEMNRKASETIERNVETLKSYLRQVNGLGMEIPVISVPTLFHKQSGKFAALTPGVANMVVLRDHLIIPDPLVPEFQKSILKSLPAAGFKPHLVPDLTYHLGVGQLHCGTNTFRHPNRYVHDRYRLAAERRLAKVQRKIRYLKMLEREN
jgi:hypothetical protein